MKKFKNLISIIICLLLVAPFGYAQETQDQFNERTKKMLQVEAKIATYIARHINIEIPKAELNQFNESSLNHDHAEDNHGHELTGKDKAKMLVEFKKNYWRIQYFNQYPKAKATYSSRVAAGSCDNGGFEDSSFANYTAETSNNYRRGDCNILTGAPPAVATVLNFAVTPFAAPRFTIMNVGNDPLVTTATLPQVWNGNHSARINDIAGGFRGDKLIKRVVLSQANERIFFNYALVMQDPGTSHDGLKPTFIARVLDNSGVESDRVCNAAYTADPFLFTAGAGRVYKPWACDNIQASGAIGDTVDLEFIMIDCGAGAHGGYAYIDDICDTCAGVPDSCNFQGSIELNPTDTCAGDTMQVCGTYILAAQNCVTAFADEIRLYVYQNGVQVGLGPIATNSSPSGGTFCFTVDPSDFPMGATGGYDFYVEIDFNLGTSGTTIQNDYHSNPGQNNDYVFDPQCCPDFEILTCCDLTPQLTSSTKSKSSVPAIPSGRTVDARVTSALSVYKQAVKAAYPVASAVNGDPCCDFCEYPNVAFPIFIYDTDGNLISDVDYNISWSNDPTNTTAIGSAMTENMVIVTVSGPDSCVWVDTFLIECCETPGNDGICCDTIDFEVDLDSLCGFDPCLFPTVQFPIQVKRNGVVLTTSGYSFQWSNGSSSSAISRSLNQLPVWVIVTDLTTGCTDTGHYDIECDPPCVPIVPSNLRCTNLGGQFLSWANIPGMTYELEMNYNDPLCCLTGIPPTGIRYTLTTNSYSGPFAHQCFSWRVRSICPDGTKSAWSGFECSCPPIVLCAPVIPTNLRCLNHNGWQTVSWATTLGLTYEVEIVLNDPFCGTFGYTTSTQIHQVNSGSYTLNVSPASGCFSWRVRSVCPDGTRSAWSGRQCCCNRIITFCNPTVPSNLRCQLTKGGQLLTWNSVPGASYEISFYYGDPKCCKNQLGYVTIPVSVNTNSFFVSSTKCFSWQIRSVCPNGTKSAWTTSSCSCSGTIVIGDPGGGETKRNINSGGSVNTQEMKVLTAPNPARDFVTFDVKTKDATQELGRIEVSSIAGEVVFNSQIKLNGKTMVDLTSLKAGTYIYKVISDGTFKSGRIVITD